MDSCLILVSSFWLEPSSYLAILKVVLGLGAVIFVHELGHFLVAKMCGVKCEKFYVGFDVPITLFGRTLIPGKLFSFQWGETEYGIGSIPLGGYVKMLGQIDNPSDVEEQLSGSLADGETAESVILESGLVDQSKLDPRSYLAKSVLQRMAIISAGVVFNLIFAVLFAACAFWSGVDYEPVVLGNSVGGGPAWKHDLAGAEVLAIGDKQIEGYYPYVSFVESIIFNGDANPIELTVRPHHDKYSQQATAGDPETPPAPVKIQLRPQKNLRRENPDLAMVGIERSLVPIIGSQETIAGSPASAANPPLKFNDRIVEVNGSPIDSEVDLRQVLTRDSAKTATLKLERKAEGSDQLEIIQTEIPVNPFREFGFATEWGPIQSRKENSPAVEADLRVGDEIVAINGQPRGNLLTLDMRMVEAAKSGPVKLTVKRDDQTLDLDINPIVPKLLANVGPDMPIAVDSLGVAIPANHTIESIEPGSAAAKAGLEIGDKLLFMNYLLSDKQKENEQYQPLIKLAKPQVDFHKSALKTSWAEANRNLQTMELGTEIELTVEREGKQVVAILASQESDRFFQATRGFYLQPRKKHYEATSIGDAFTNGGWQVVTDLKRVGTTLKKLVKGEISATNLGGPGTIAVAATSEASAGTSRLLLFLTFLSANLAIVNFLPIPVLDGGHMMFLAYEGIFRRPVNETVQVVLTWGGLLLILSLMIFVISLDVFRISNLF